MLVDADAEEEPEVRSQCDEYRCDDGTCSDTCNPAPVFVHDPSSGYLTTFPDDFVFGVTASAYQIEGAWNEDGKGESTWDRFVHEPGRILNGETGDVACDHYHRYREDVALMADAGIPAYNLTTAWTRIIPDGVGAVNEAGIDFYSRLVDELLRNGITPWLTLYHWDLPQALEDRGGWLNRETVDHFVRYAQVVSEALGDRVKN